MSNSNPTWNSTELELVEVGVDFVFQCHNKKNKNPHLILLNRKGLQVFIWRGWKGGCLECSWKASGGCREGVWNVPYNNFAGSPKQFRDQKFSGPKFFWDQKFLGFKIFLDLNFLGPKIFGDPRFFWTQNIWDTIFFGIFKDQFFWTQIFSGL